MVVSMGSRRTLCSLAVATIATLLAVAGCDASSAAWLLGTLLTSLSPAGLGGSRYSPLPFARRLEEWAYGRWEISDPPLSPSVPLPVPEVLPTAATEDIDLRAPFIVRGLFNGSAALGAQDWLRDPPVGELEVPYYSNASDGALRPDSVGRLAEVADAIQAGGPQKLATELVFRRHPQLIERLQLAPPLARLFGSSTFEQWRLGKTLTVPIFMGTGAADAAVRTDLHAEPIGSATLALSGSKVWTLVPASESHLLRPSVASDGRAFFRTRRAHGAAGALAIAESGAAHYVVEQSAGDVLWVPTWCWHRVDYQARAWRREARLRVPGAT